MNSNRSVDAFPLMSLKEILQGEEPILAASKEDEELFKRARAGDATLLLRSDIATLKNLFGVSLLHELAASGCEYVLRHREVASVRDGYGETPLHYLANEGHAVALQHPRVGIVSNKGGRTPLHLLAYEGCEAVLQHPKAKTAYDNLGCTPAYILGEVIREQKMVRSRKRRFKPKSEPQQGSSHEVL